LSRRAHQPIKAVLFDLNETLIDAEKGLRAAHANVARIIHSLCLKEIAIRSILKAIAQLDDEMNKCTKYNRDGWWQELVDRLGYQTTLSSTSIRTLTESYWGSYAKAAEPYDDVGGVLPYLRGKGYRLGIVTDTDGALGLKKARIDCLGFRAFFDTVVIAGEDTRITKPDPGPFLLAASRLSVPPSECTFVGDKPFTDIKGANDAGMQSILVIRRHWGSRDIAGFTIKQLAELKEIL